MKKFKTAFTLLELVFVIMVVGILAAVIMPRMNENNALTNAAFQLVSDIRYTQHLAMQDDKIDSTDNSWFKERWQLLFGKSTNTNNQYAYTIFSNGMTGGAHDGAPNLSEIAINPMNSNQLMTGGYTGLFATSDPRATKEMNLGEKYGITDITTSGCVNYENNAESKRVAFDYLGRPYSGDSSSWANALSGLLRAPCTITLHKNSDSISIRIHPFSGYTCILDSSGNCI